ncbi:hypothetical protein HMPREF9946_01392 [Acetobacteraceae bacterium AT-5844]|nr:hypothetical protein HMPREF9946_01392 [Acetobacteraceae bacterium AT-5844]
MAASLHREMALIEDAILTVTTSGAGRAGRLSCVTCSGRSTRQDCQALGACAGFVFAHPMALVT